MMRDETNRPGPVRVSLLSDVARVASVYRERGVDAKNAHKYTHYRTMKIGRSELRIEVFECWRRRFGLNTVMLDQRVNNRGIRRSMKI